MSERTFRVWRGTAAGGSFVEHRIEVDEYRELDDERVLVLTRYSGRGKTSGLELEQVRTKVAHILSVRGSKVTKFVAYFDHERALADLGLSSGANSPGS